MLNKIIIIFILGGIGALCRYFLSDYIGKKYVLNIPLNILIINLIGCFLVGIIFEYIKKYYDMDSLIYIFVLTAFFGSFTTFSAFILESYLILKKSGYFLVVSYFFINLLLNFASLLMGVAITRFFFKCFVN